MRRLRIVIIEDADQPQHQARGAGDPQLAFGSRGRCVSRQVIGARRHLEVWACRADSLSFSFPPAWPLTCSSINPSCHGATLHGALAGSGHLAFTRIA